MSERLHDWLTAGKLAILAPILLWGAASALAQGRYVMAFVTATLGAGFALLLYTYVVPPTRARTPLIAGLVLLATGLVFLAGASAADAEAGRDRPPIVLGAH